MEFTQSSDTEVFEELRADITATAVQEAPTSRRWCPGRYFVVEDVAVALEIWKTRTAQPTTCQGDS